MTLLEALAVLQLEVDVPVGVSISRDGGDPWPCFRFAEMAHPHDDRAVSEIAVALETLLRAAKSGDLGERGIDF